MGPARKRTGRPSSATKRAGRATDDRARETASSPGEKARRTAYATTGAEQGLSPTEHLQQSLQNLAGAVAERALGGVAHTVTGTADRLHDYADGGGGDLLAAVTGVDKLAGGVSPMRAAMSAGAAGLGHSVQETFQHAKDSLLGGKGKGSGGKKLKLTNIVEQIDVGVPVRLAYDQWTRFADFPKFMKKVEQVEQVSDEKLRWTGKVFWSRRSWESTVVEQVPFDRIIWRSKGDKGYIDGAVTFHELAPDLTRIIMVLEYHPGGVFEKTANLWRAVGRRARLELKHFQRQVMTDTLLHPGDVEGWHGEIRDKKVVSQDAVGGGDGEDGGTERTRRRTTRSTSTARDEKRATSGDPQEPTAPVRRRRAAAARRGSDGGDQS